MSEVPGRGEGEGHLTAVRLGVSSSARRRWFAAWAMAALAALAMTLAVCKERSAGTLLLLLCFDGMSPDLLDELRSQAMLPTLDGLIRRGAYGSLRSLPARRVMRTKPQRGYWSPIVWATIATGKMPEKHGILDFLLPLPGTSRVWMGSEEDPASAELFLPEIEATPPLTLHLRLRSYDPNGEQSVELRFNDEPLAILRVTTQWKDFSAPIGLDALRPGRNRVELVFSRQSRPANQGSFDRRPLAAELGSLEVKGARGRSIVRFDPVFDRFALGRGFYQPHGEVTEAQSIHWQAEPIWNLLGGWGHPVAVIGYWSTWPAYEVRGLLVSSGMGLRGRRAREKSGLTWPPELAAELVALAPGDAEVDAIENALHLGDCSPVISEKKRGLRGVIEQDELYHRIARKHLAKMKKGFATVYFEMIDGASHEFLHWRAGAPIPPDCPESARGIVDAAYVQADRRIAELLGTIPPEATVVVVSDHGAVPGDLAGYHAPEGVFIAAGRGIRAGVKVHGADVLDVTPTLLHLLEAPIPLDMDGKPLHQIFDVSWLAAHPPRYVDQDTSRSPGAEAGRPDPAVEKEMLERLRGLGYVQ